LAEIEMAECFTFCPGDRPDRWRVVRLGELLRRESAAEP
jgi:hypothetical protein